MSHSPVSDQYRLNRPPRHKRARLESGQRGAVRRRAFRKDYNRLRIGILGKRQEAERGRERGGQIKHHPNDDLAPAVSPVGNLQNTKTPIGNPREESTSHPKSTSDPPFFPITSQPPETGAPTASSSTIFLQRCAVTDPSRPGVESKEDGVVGMRQRHGQPGATTNGKQQSTHSATNTQLRGRAGGADRERKREITKTLVRITQPNGPGFFLSSSPRDRVLRST